MIYITIKHDGESWPHEMLKELKNGKTLYIGPKNILKWRQENWANYDITYTTWFKCKETCVRQFDRLIIEDYRLTEQLDKLLRNYEGSVYVRPKDFMSLVKFISKVLNSIPVGAQ